MVRFMRGLIFDKAETVFDVSKVIQDNVDRISFLQPEILNHHYHSLIAMEDAKQEKFMNFVHFVDTSYSPHGSSSLLRQKLFTVLAGATYYYDFYNQISNYTNKELAILSKWSIIEPVDNYSETLERFPQSVLSLIAMKAKTTYESDDLILWYDYFYNSEEDRAHLENRLQKEALTSLLSESFKIQEKIIKEMEMDDSRRI